MEVQQIIVISVIALSFLFFVKEWLPVEITALSAAAILILTGVIQVGDFIGGFSNTAPITIGCMFVMSAALERTGVIDSLGRMLIRLARGSLYRALALIMLVPLPLSAMMNNTPIVVILLPAIIALARQSNLPSSKLLIPLSYATILGGTCSMVGTSTNLIADGIARDLGMEAFSLFSIAPLGIIYSVVGVVFIMVIGVRLLPARDTVSSILTPEMTREFLVQATVPVDSPLAGRKLGDLLKETLRGMHILEVRRRGLNLTEDLKGIVLRTGDRLLVRTGTRGVHHLKSGGGVRVGFDSIAGLQAMEEREAVLMEGIVGPNSNLVGKTLRQIRFRQRYGLLILAIHRQGRNITSNMENLPIEFGDTLLVEGPREGINRLLEDRDFISLTEPAEKPVHARRAPLAIAAAGGFIVGGFLGVDTALLAFLAALFVIVTRCLNANEAYAAINWRILLLIIGMLAVGRGMESSGTAALVASGIAHLAAPLGALAMLSALYFVTSICTELVSNNAVAALFTPVAVNLAHQADASPIPFVIAVMFGASASFATPIGYQTNTYVYGAGGYRFSDFLRVGLPLNLMLWLVATFVIPLIWKLHP